MTRASSHQKISDEGNTQVPILEKPDEGNLEEKVFVDNSDEAMQLREKIVQEFEKLTDELQLSFAKTQLGPGPIQSQWKENFRDRLKYSDVVKLNRMAPLLSQFRARGGRYIGDHSEYRRDANELEECLNL